jgi:phosphate transport system substrate-binding protein
MSQDHHQHTNHRLTLTWILKGIGSFALVAALLAFYGILFFGSPVEVVATRTSQADTKNGDGGVVKASSEAGMLGLAYNLPGVKGRLNLPQDVYADIFLGKIRMWNDPRIRAANKDLNLPAITIAVICRQDSSEATFAFTNHLATVSASWAAGPSTGKIIEWPHFVMLARGNEGVASKIKISEGSIGYIDYGFARRLGLQMAALAANDEQGVASAPVSGAAADAPKS